MPKTAAPFDANFSANDVSCNSTNNGSININPNGNTYSYSWSNGETTQNISNLSAGTYTVTLTTTGLCSMDTTIVIGESIGLNVSGTAMDASCNNDGSISLNVSGGTEPYSYTWNPPLANSPTVNNLTPNNYEVNGN